jgi:DNA-binding MarR family transcriptional regulator
VRQRWSAMFAAVALVLPDGAAAVDALARDDFVGAVVRRGMDHYRTGVRLLRFAPELRVFAERNAGLMILFSLVIAADPDDTIPPTRPVRVSISELARRFSVSRVHVGRLLRDAEAEGLIERAGNTQDAITLLPPLTRALRQSTALVFLFFAHCARAALADIGEENQSAYA